MRSDIAQPSSFEQYCDLSRQYDPDPSPSTLPDGTIVPAYKGPGVNTFVESFGRDDLLDFSEWWIPARTSARQRIDIMSVSTYWINQGAPNADFWAHEV